MVVLPAVGKIEQKPSWYCVAEGWVWMLVSNL